MKEACRPQGGVYWKTKLIWSHSLRVSWLAYKLFSRPSYREVSLLKIFERRLGFSLLRLLLIIIMIIIIGTNHNKAKIMKLQQNSRCKLCGDWNESINPVISKCSKLVQKEYKTRHDWRGKVINLELYKKLKFDHTNKWFMHNPETVQENETHKLLWDFEIQTDHLISDRWQDLLIINKKKRELTELWTGWLQSKTERKWKER